jgi:heat shock protein HslJ
MSRYLRAIPFLALATVLLAACSPGRKGLDATSWQLETYRGPEGELTEVLPASVVTLDFQADQASGISGCNNYTGSYQSTGSEVEFGPLASTRKLCVRPEGVMEQEAAYLAALGSAASYNLAGDTLELKDAQGEQLAVFARATGSQQ